MREPLINKVLVIRLTLLATVVSVVALMIPYPQSRIQVVSPDVNTTQTEDTDSNS